MDGIEVFSNLWLSFPHIPVKTPLDFLSIDNGFFLADELWSLADNRKSMSLLSDVITIILLRSRKRKFRVSYTQQFMQIDIRIAYVTDAWTRPHTIPSFTECEKYKLTPETLVLEKWDGDLNPIPSESLSGIKAYFPLYDTNRDPYTLSSLISNKHLREVLDRVTSNEEKELQLIGEQAKRSGKIWKLN